MNGFQYEVLLAESSFSSMMIVWVVCKNIWLNFQIKVRVPVSI